MDTPCQRISTAKRWNMRIFRTDATTLLWPYILKVGIDQRFAIDVRWHSASFDDGRERCDFIAIENYADT
jgi:hypothetical protein